MNLLLNLGRRRNQTLSQVLSSFLSRTKEGKEIIRAFGKDRESASTAVVSYIEQHLKDQPEFQRQIQDALGSEQGERFTTLVAAGGHVDQLINAEVVEQLEIRYYLFQDSRQVITFLLGLVLIGAAIASLYWWSIQPRRMTGDFNIAIAQFSQFGDKEPQVAEIVSQQVFRFLDDQAKLIAFENIQVSHEHIGVISNAQDARDLSERINAQVVIYGDVTTLGGQARLIPQFYVSAAFRADASELNGQQKLAAPIVFPLADLLKSDAESTTLMQERAVIMTQFMKALVYLKAERLSLAQEAVEQAILHANLQEPFEGQEVLYLFGAHIHRLQQDPSRAQTYVDEALRLNTSYGRGYIAQAHIYYDQGELSKAVEYYEKAKQLQDQPFGAFITEKANFGIGNCCWVQLQSVKQGSAADTAAVAELEQCVLDHYQWVIDSFVQQQEPGENLTEITAWSYYGIGTVLQDRGETQSAASVYEQARKLTIDDDLIELIDPRLEEVNK